VLQGFCAELDVSADVCGVLLLLASELMTNAVVHGSGPARLRVNLEEAHLLLAATDSSDRLPVVKDVGPSAPGGRGMRLLQDLSETWGVREDPFGKTVWCRIAVRSHRRFR